MSRRSLRIIDCLLFWSVLVCLLVVPQLIDSYWEDESALPRASSIRQMKPTPLTTSGNQLVDVPMHGRSYRSTRWICDNVHLHLQSLSPLRCRYV